MTFTPAQKILIRTTAIGAGIDIGSLTAVSTYFNALFNPDYWVWRTDVSRAEVYNQQDWEGNFWDWTTYKNQQLAEQNAWVQMFMQDVTNFAQLNVRNGIAAIFSGTGAPALQRAHCLSVGRRKATNLEKLFAVGLGTTIAPSTMVIEGLTNPNDFIGIQSWV